MTHPKEQLNVLKGIILKLPESKRNDIWDAVRVIREILKPVSEHEALITAIISAEVTLKITEDGG